jgi:hypothetical protein
VRRFDLGRVLRPAVLITLMNAGCDETLPPRLTDPNPISVAAKILSGRVIVQRGVVSGNAGVIEVSVTNTYTEVLQDTAAVNIRCRIWLAGHPDSAGAATIDISSLTEARFVQGGNLTLVPGAIAVFDKHWDYTTPGGTPFWDLIPLKDTSDAHGLFRLSAPVEVVMSDTLRLFRPVPDFTIGPHSFTLQFEVR